MLLLSQIREELALYFELLQTPTPAAGKAVRDRVVNLHNELVKIEVVAAVVPVADIQSVLTTYENLVDADDAAPPASFAATLKAVDALVEARKPKAPESKQPTAVEPTAVEPPAAEPSETKTE